MCFSYHGLYSHCCFRALGVQLATPSTSPWSHNPGQHLQTSSVLRTILSASLSLVLDLTSFLVLGSFLSSLLRTNIPGTNLVPGLSTAKNHLDLAATALSQHHPQGQSLHRYVLQVLPCHHHAVGLKYQLLA